MWTHIVISLGSLASGNGPLRIDDGVRNSADAAVLSFFYQFLHFLFVRRGLEERKRLTSQIYVNKTTRLWSVFKLTFRQIIPSMEQRNEHVFDRASEPFEVSQSTDKQSEYLGDEAHKM